MTEDRLKSLPGVPLSLFEIGCQVTPKTGFHSEHGKCGSVKPPLAENPFYVNNEGGIAVTGDEDPLESAGGCGISYFVCEQRR